MIHRVLSSSREEVENGNNVRRQAATTRMCDEPRAFIIGNSRRRSTDDNARETRLVARNGLSVDEGTRADPNPTAKRKGKKQFRNGPRAPLRTFTYPDFLSFLSRVNASFPPRGLTPIHAVVQIRDWEVRCTDP